MHPTLERQIKKLLSEMQTPPAGWGDFIERVSQTYIDYEEDRKLIERSLDISSREMSEVNAKLQEQAKELGIRVEEQEKMKKALFNIMDDLRQEKILTEREKAKDDILLQSIGDGMIAIDTEGKIVKVNSVTQEMVELEEDVLQKDVFEVFQVFDPADMLVSRKDRPEILALSTGKQITEAYTIHRKGGKKRVINIIANPVLEHNVVIGAIMIYRDVTKEREIDRMKTEFISLASHQLRTPLSAIRWFAELLLSGDAGELTTEQMDFAKNIYASAERMIELVGSLLNISRIESGRIIVDPHPTDLQELLTDVVKDLQVKLEEQHHQLSVSVHPELGKINLDSHLIRQVYMNLLSNAIKYTPKGGEISVFVSRKEDQIVSQITDNGYGIPKNAQNRLYEKFFRAENVAKVVTDGTGLGLYLIKAIIESSGGKIWFESEEGKGTTFWFSLPASGMKAKAGEVVLDS